MVEIVVAGIEWLLRDTLTVQARLLHSLCFGTSALGSDFDREIDCVVLVRTEIRIGDCLLSQFGANPGGHVGVNYDPSIHFILYYGRSLVNLGYG